MSYSGWISPLETLSLYLVERGIHMTAANTRQECLALFVDLCVVFPAPSPFARAKLLQAVLCCVQCCLWCLEKCMKFLNKNAYIQTAIFGYSFCTAAKKAFFLIARNIMRVMAVGVVSEVVLILGKVCGRLHDGSH